MAQLRTQPFGSRRSPANWSGVAAFIRFAMAKLCGITLSTYADDCSAVEPQATVQSAFECVRAVCALCGLDLEQSKESKPATSMDLLGARITLHAGSVEDILPDAKRNALVTDLEDFLPNGTLCPAEAAKMRGRLGRAQTLLSGRTVRALPHPLSQRQYSSKASASTPLSTELRESIAWWIANVGRSAPRHVLTSKVKQVLVYTDACGEGHLGAISYTASEMYTVSARIPEWSRARAQAFTSMNFWRSC